LALVWQPGILYSRVLCWGTDYTALLRKAWRQKTIQKSAKRVSYDILPSTEFSLEQNEIRSRRKKTNV
jgi:hypothetical protein